MRNLIQILDKIIKILPERGEEKMRSDLEGELKSASYTAPENMHIKWNNVQKIITEKFKNHTDISSLPEWGVMLIEIWTDKVIESEKE
jgi:hypothetical protein